MGQKSKKLNQPILMKKSGQLNAHANCKGDNGNYSSSKNVGSKRMSNKGSKRNVNPGNNNGGQGKYTSGAYNTEVNDSWVSTPLKSPSQIPYNKEMNLIKNYDPRYINEASDNQRYKQNYELGT